MFERRIKILLTVLAGFIVLLLLRASWLQVVQGAEWERRAADSSRHVTDLETSRGNIVDYRNRIVAEDAPCIDAAVDYRAIDPDAEDSKEWVRNEARRRVLARGPLKGSKDDRTLIVDQEIERMKADWKVMWETMAKVSGKNLDEIVGITETIKRRVEMRRKYVWNRKFEAAKERHDNEKKEPTPGWLRWLVDDTKSPGPQIDSFKVLVSEQTETHAILHAIDNDAYLVLDKLRERCPGLELKKGTRRS